LAGARIEDGRYLAGVRTGGFGKFSSEFFARFFSAQILAGISWEASCWAVLVRWSLMSAAFSASANHGLFVDRRHFYMHHEVIARNKAI
jgi:hypothetical protein